MSTAHPLKRQRMNSEKSGEDHHACNVEQEGPAERSYLWFNDGNVVLQAEKKLFRVHKTVLALHSDFFSDMFSLPEPQDDASQPTCDEGCPLIFLSDSATDVTCLLSSIYENHKKHGFNKEMDVQRAVSLYRLGKKYGIQYLVDEILRLLRKDYPSTLKAYRHDSSKALDIFDDDDDVDQLGIIANLAYENKILVVLPAIYAEFAHYTTRELFDMRKKDLINPTVFEICLVGKENFTRALKDAMEKRSSSVAGPPQYDYEGGCHEKLPDLICSITTDICKGGRVRCFRDLEDIHLIVRWVCKECLRFIEACYKEICRDMWEKLPSFFELPPWAECKKS
ncbi:hypothetical protein CPC08DRAFT_751318 [Agrocybe pediades]|nr:hypothetical protein CPC08DRAFT_751318 [Agrocybe pediades]